MQHNAIFFFDISDAGCTQLPDPGPCRAYFPSWYFDVRSGSCQQFIYGGCDGNANNYSNREECESMCSSSKSVKCNKNDIIIANSTCTYVTRAS